MLEKEILLKLASRIRYERKKKDFSQEQLANLSNLSMRSISLLEQGLSNVKFLTLYKISIALNIEVKELFDFHL